MIRFRSAVSLLVAILLASAAGAQTPPAKSILELIPDDAQAAIIIPNLKSFSDQLTRMLEGMSRENLLLGSRPIDQFKSISGFNLGINDVGSVAIAVFESDSPEPGFALIVPVTDANAFLEGNLLKDEQGHYHTPEAQGGTPLHVKSFDSYVALSETPEAVARIGPSERSLAQSGTELGEQFKRLTSSGEAFLFLTEHGSKSARQFALQAQAQFTGAPVDQLNALGEVQAGVLVLDFDALALVLRGLVRFTPESAFSKIANQHQAKPALMQLPAKPFYLAASADIASIGGFEVLNALAQGAGWPSPLQWLSNVTSIEFAAYPSPAGVAGGLLNDSVLVLQTDDPASIVAGIKQSLTDAGKNPSIKREVKWEDARAVEGVGTASAYEVKILDVPPDFAALRMAEQVIVGRSGWRGFVHQTPNSVIMTFSQRPAVLKSAIESAASTSNTGAQGLGNNAAVRALRQWLPQSSDIQLYFGLGQFGALAQQMAQAFGQAEAVNIPKFDAELPPIAVGIDAFPGGMESSTVIPADVLTVILDEMTGARGSGGGPLDEPAEDAPE